MVAVGACFVVKNCVRVLHLFAALFPKPPLFPEPTGRPPFEVFPSPLSLSAHALYADVTSILDACGTLDNFFAPDRLDWRSSFPWRGFFPDMHNSVRKEGGSGVRRTLLPNLWEFGAK